jgi:WD40-like Beta Propeller Repeat
MVLAPNRKGGFEMNKSKHYITTLGGAIVLVWAFTASSRAQSYSDWSAPINLGPTVNSAFMDRGPAISKDGLSLYFASTRPGAGGFGGEDIYVSQRESGDSEWGTPVNLGPIINTTANEMVPAFSRDGHLLFFASNRLGGFGGVDIWVSRREQTHDDFAWQPAENLGAGVNSFSLDEGPSYFENDEVGVPQLYFSSSRLSGGPGSIFVSEQAADGSFGPAVLVFELSGLGNTRRPSIGHDGREIFFTSNRPGSIADSQDLWVATRETVFDAWSEPINLGSPLNTELVDVQPYISSDRETLFFASNRPSGGPTDLYMSTRTKLPEE